MSRFQGKTVLITGGTSGIGLATAKEFFVEGAKVIITSRNQENIDRTLAKLDERAVGFVSNAGEMADLQRLAMDTKKYTESIDVLFVNAGYGKFNSLAETTEEDFDSQFNTLVKGCYFTVQQLVPLINEGGSIIINTSIITDIAPPGGSVYGAAKSAVRYLSKSFANELKDEDIRVNAVSPGPIGTNFLNEAGVSEEEQQQMTEQIISKVPMNRFGEPKEIAKTVIFLASDDASYITGHEIQVDGGMVQV